MTRFRNVSKLGFQAPVTQGEHKYWLCNTGDPLIQVCLHCISVLGILNCSCSRQEALNIVTIKSGLTGPCTFL